jgi:uncharacterized integral membrane protein
MPSRGVSRADELGADLSRSYRVKETTGRRNVTNEKAASQGGKSGVGVGTIIGGITAVIALIFILQNTGSQEMEFLAWSINLPMWLWALILFGLGGVSGYFFHWQRVRARRKDRRD